jgi:hypothetical protein
MQSNTLGHTAAAVLHVTNLSLAYFCGGHIDHIKTTGCSCLLG